MRSLLLIACALVACVQGLGGDYKREKEIGKVHVQCITDSGIDPEAAVGNADDPHLASYVGCVYRRLNIINEEGDVDIVQLQKVIINNLGVENRAVAEEAVRKCHDEQDWTPEETALNIENCLYETFNEHIVLIEY